MSEVAVRPAVQRPAPRYHVPAEVALAALTLATVFGFSRVFLTGEFWGPLFLVTAYSHIALIALRRRGVGILLSAAISFVGLLLTLTYTFFASTLRFGLPSGATIEAARAAMEQSWTTFQTAQAPAPVETGFLLASAFAIFFAVFLADWAAFRLWSSWESLVPATTIFIFCSVLGATERRTESVVAFTTTAVLFLLLHRIARRETSAGWLASDAVRGATAWFRVGAVLGVACVLGGVVVGPRLPGVERGAIFGRDAAKKSDRFTVSPLVEIQSRMSGQPDVEMFTVRADREAYWRLTALDTFDGNTWRSKGKFVEASGDLPAPAVQGRGQALNQTYDITALARLWLPAAYQVDRVSESARARYHDESGTLIVDTDFETSDGLQYSVESNLPSFDEAVLRTADNRSMDAEARKRYTELPAGWATVAPQQARVVADAARANTDFDKARALQDYFQDPSNGFVYDLTVAPGHSGSAIDGFLKSKRGYCEQFAGSFAAMARSLGLPARVAVGFTWGQRDANDPKLFRVRGEHAHAWPEVYLGQYGWVSFEPTPSRGEPGSASWTGLEPSQVVPSGTVGSTGTTTRAVTPGSAGTTTSTADPSQNLESNLPPPTTPGSGADGDDASGGGGSFVGSLIALLGGVLVVLVLLACYALAVSSWLARQHRSRRALAQTPADWVRVSWADAIDHLAMAGAMPDRAETHTEFAERAVRLLPETAGPMAGLAAGADAATYANEGLDPAVAEYAAEATGEIRNAVEQRVSPARQRLIRLNPAWVFRRAQLPNAHHATSSHLGA